MALSVRIAATAALLSLVACATTESTSQFHVEDPADYSGFLIVGQTGAYSSRADFERLVVSELRERGASATAYHVAAGGDVPISRESIAAAVQSGNFEAIVLTRALSGDVEARLREGATDTLARTRADGLFDAFRYDYKDIKEPSRLDLSATVTFVAELYDIEDRTLVWSSRISTAKAETIEELVSDAARSLVQRLEADGLIRN